MNKEEFRRQLRDESQQWQEEGLIEPNLYQLLAERYAFSDLSEEPHNRFVGVLLGLGGILLGLGAITFVAANWQAWSRVARMILLLSLFFGVNTTGFYLWRNPQKRSRLNRLGHGLLLTGGLILGANLGLMAQMFHQGGPIYQLYFIWSLGILVMAYGLRLTSLGIFSWILMMCSYFTFQTSSLSSINGLSILEYGMLYLPILISVFYLPLAHWLRSRWLYGLWGVSFMLLFGLSPINLLGATASIVFAWGNFSALNIAVGTILPASVLWVYRFDLGRKTRQRSQFTRPDLFQSVGRSLSIWSLSFILYIYAFRFPWKNTLFRSQEISDVVSLGTPLLMILVYLLIAVYGWAIAFRNEHFSGGTKWLNSPVMAGFLVSFFGLAIACHSKMSLTIIGPALVNLLLFALSIALIHDGLMFVVRRRFWGGMFILVIGLVSRMFEYNTGLTLKALVLSLCGLGIIAAGLWFEYRVKPPVQAVLKESNG